MIHSNLLEPFFDVVVDENIGDYQGDTLIVLKNRLDYSWDTPEEKWGFLVTGYGSCSGCDAWENAETGLDKFKLLAAEIESIKWFGSLKEVQDYVSDKYARELEWYANESEYKDFVEKVLKISEGGNEDG
jgi:hypothetical protein